MTKSKTTVSSSAPSKSLQKPSPKVFQFKIKLCGIRPMIWRRVQLLSNSTFEDLHHAIQDSMEWEGYHLHEFSIGNPNKVKLDQYFSLHNKTVRYTYDFGDDWEHDIVLEKILELEENQTYPRCIAGKRACPPEDCGGIWGYQELLEILTDPNHEDYEERLEWCGDEFDPEKFDCSKVLLNIKSARKQMRKNNKNPA